MTGNLLTDELTEKEILTLVRLAKGKTPQEIARLDSVCMDVIYKRQKNIRSKLGVETDCHAVAIAMSAGIIE